MKYIITYILLALTLLACERALEVPFPEHEPKMVINSFLDTGKPIEVYISRSYGSLEILDNKDLNVPDAQVELFEGGNRLGIMTYVDTLLQDTLFDGTTLSRTLSKYYLEGITTKAGKTYEIKATHPKYPTATASTTVPAQVQLTDAELMQNVHRYTISDGIGEFQSLLRINIKDPADEKNYYRIKLEVVIPDTHLLDLPTIERAYVAGPERGRDANGAYKIDGPWLTDEGKDGQAWTQDFVVSLPNSFDPADEIKEMFISKLLITLYSANEDSYQYLQKLQLQQENDTGLNLFPPEAIVVYSNVEGGFGIFGGLCVNEMEF